MGAEPDHGNTRYVENHDHQRKEHRHPSTHAQGDGCELAVGRREAVDFERLPNERPHHPDAGELLAQRLVDGVDALLHGPESRHHAHDHQGHADREDGHCDQQQPGEAGVLTDGGYFLVEAIVPPGGGPPLHIQTREEEAFYVLEGQLSFYGANNEVVAGPGTYLNIPKGDKHRFHNNGNETAKMLFFFTPAGLEGLFDRLGDMEPPTGDAASIIESLNVLGQAYGVEYLNE